MTLRLFLSADIIFLADIAEIHKDGLTYTDELRYWKDFKRFFDDEVNYIADARDGKIAVYLR